MPVNQTELEGTTPANWTEIAGTMPVNQTELEGTTPANWTEIAGTMPAYKGLTQKGLRISLLLLLVPL